MHAHQQEGDHAMTGTQATRAAGQAAHGSFQQAYEPPVIVALGTLADLTLKTGSFKYDFDGKTCSVVGNSKGTYGPSCGA